MSIATVDMKTSDVVRALGGLLYEVGGGRWSWTHVALKLTGWMHVSEELAAAAARDAILSAVSPRGISIQRERVLAYLKRPVCRGCFVKHHPELECDGPSTRMDSPAMML